MKQQRPVQELDQRDSAVRTFVQQCEVLQHPVSIRLVGVTSSDVDIQVSRLQKTFGDAIAMTQPRQSGHGREWIAYGTIKR